MALFTYEIRQKAEVCHDPPRLIMHEAHVKLSFDTAITVPQCTALQCTTQRIRRENDIPTEPKTFGDIVVPSDLQNTVTNQKFLFYDSNDHHCRLLIFADKEQLDFLNGCESWHCDSTFTVSIYNVTQIPFKNTFFSLYVAPQLFKQMYSIHGSVRGEKLPLVYSLLPNKKQATYEELFRIIEQHIEHKPKYATIDFEKGAENAFSVVFRQCDVFGCFFHFKQCI